MKIKEIRELIDFISSSGLDEVNIETEEFKISVKKNAMVTQVKEVAAPAPAAPVATQPTNGAEASAPKEPATPKEEDNYLTIKSPMVGTFYRAANPEAENFVKVGDKITSGQPVCIVEAMKLFNEIEADVSGTIVKILCDNASPVEFDQPLFLVDPA